MSDLPVSIGHLSSLETLRIRDNEFTSLPSSLSKLGALRKLDIRNNPFEHEHPGTSTNRVLEHLADLKCIVDR